MKYKQKATQQEIENAFQEAIVDESRKPCPEAIIARSINGFDELKVYGFDYFYEVDDYVREYPNKKWILESHEPQVV